MAHDDDYDDEPLNPDTRLARAVELFCDSLSETQMNRIVSILDEPQRRAFADVYLQGAERNQRRFARHR